MILSGLLLIPLLGFLAVLMLPKTAQRQIRLAALLTTGLTCALSFVLLAHFDPRAGLQFEERLRWIPQFGVSYHLGVDGLSVPMILLTTLLSFLACLASNTIRERIKEYYALYLLLVLGMLGTFVALDLFLFYVFWELVLVPMYFLIGIWGGGRREYSAFKFFVYTLAGMSRTWELGLQQMLFLGFFLGFAIKVPVFPFHT